MKIIQLLNSFRLKTEREEIVTVIDNIDKGVVFRGTNLWVLIFAIFIASLGLNVNSTAVIIGAMLVSPLMGPIMGMGLGVAINDLDLIKKAVFNFLFASVVSLLTSTLFFILTPINDAHSELLARTQPNVYDVLIALFGGLAGILAIASKQKGNVLPGVAIATALMPPLCTAGYGIATMQLNFFFGAGYLYLINTVFIALATLITVRFLKFPFKKLPDPTEDRKARQIIGFIVMLTLVPSIYFAYDIVKQNNFKNKANQFIETAAVFPNDYLLQKNIDSKNRIIQLTYGGAPIDSLEIENVKSRLNAFGLDGTHLEIRQGFSSMVIPDSDPGQISLRAALDEKNRELIKKQSQLDSLEQFKQTATELFHELHVLYPDIDSIALQPGYFASAFGNEEQLLVLVFIARQPDLSSKKSISEWLRIRLKSTSCHVIFQ